MKPLIPVLFTALLLTACGQPNTGDPRPGSTEDCLAWAMADHAAAPDEFQNRHRLAGLLTEHFEGGRLMGQKPSAIIARQEALLRFSAHRPRRAQDRQSRAYCLKRYALPKAESAAEPEAETENARR
jgi:hypothetical protein